jgi:hypothetical protein
VNGVLDGYESVGNKEDYQRQITDRMSRQIDVRRSFLRMNGSDVQGEQDKRDQEPEMTGYAIHPSSFNMTNVEPIIGGISLGRQAPPATVELVIDYASGMKQRKLKPQYIIIRSFEKLLSNLDARLRAQMLIEIMRAQKVDSD